uniref:Uncharacterized protein n=1 Tax=Quercus lobata TaxID=97700 RepID=A0A7N2L9W0_QUELO
MATLILAVKLTAYLNGVIHLELADAANGLTNFLGTSYIMSILVAILADTYIGRYKAGGCLELVVYVAAIHNRNLDLAEDLTKLYEIDHDLEAAMETEFLPQRHFQLQTFSVQQALNMNTSISKSFHIPPASLPIIPILFIVPVYDQIFIPFARKITGIPNGIMHLQCIGVGLILSCISMAVAGFLDVK